MNNVDLQQRKIMAKMNMVYAGDLRCEIVHEYSQSQIETDAPLDNQGKAQRFSPTDLLCTSLATCVITTIAIAAQARKWPFTNAKASIEKIMQDNPRRIGEIKVHITIGKHGYSEETKEKIKAYSRACPVSRSLNPEVIQTVTFEFED